MHILVYAYIACYTLWCEAKKYPLSGSTALLESVAGFLARSQRVRGPSAQALHPTRLPGLRQRKEAPQLFAGLHRQWTTALPLCAFGYGASAQTRLAKWPPDRALALQNGAGLVARISNPQPLPNRSGRAGYPFGSQKTKAQSLVTLAEGIRAPS